MIFGYALDYSKVRRSLRARIALGTLTVLTFVIWGGGYAWQRKQVSRERTMEDDWEEHKLDWTDSGYAGPMMLYFL